MREVADLAYDPSAQSHPGDVVERIRASLRRLHAVPLAELVKETSRMFPSLAEELEKSVPVVECQDQRTVLNQEWAEVMRDVLVQSFRNALAHGIESREERQAASKKPQGLLRLHSEKVEDGLRIHLSDDGKGLALDSARAADPTRRERGRGDCRSHLLGGRLDVAQRLQDCRARGRHGRRALSREEAGR